MEDLFEAITRQTRGVRALPRQLTPVAPQARESWYGEHDENFDDAAWLDLDHAMAASTPRENGIFDESILGGPYGGDGDGGF